MNESTGTIPNHDDAASALMALSGTADANSSDGSIEPNPPNPPPPPVESAASSPKLAAAAISANRFPEKLMAVLNSDGYSNIITWSPDGKSFIFTDSNSFERILLPKIFKVAKFDSFLRKLYRWGFSKCQLLSRVGCPAYKHEKFNRDEPNLMGEMECRSKPKTQYGNAAPMTLTSFHQSAPQLRGSSSAASYQNNLSNAGWDQAQVFNPPGAAFENSESLADEDSSMADMTTEQGNHNHVLGNAANRESGMPALFEPSRGLSNLFNGGSAQASVDQIMAQQLLLNQHAAARGRNLMGNHTTAAGALRDRQQQSQAESETARPFSARSKTTPFNMKFMETTESSPNSSFSNNAQSQFFPSGSNAEPHATNPFLQQMNFNGFGHSNSQSSPQQGLMNHSFAELQALRLQEQQAMMRNPHIEALQLLRLTEERNRLNGQRMNDQRSNDQQFNGQFNGQQLNDQVQNHVMFQRQLEQLQMQNEVERRMQLQVEVDRLRQLNESQRGGNGNASEADRQIEARRALIEKLARNRTQSFGP